MSTPALLGNDVGELVDLDLCPAHRSQLKEGEELDKTEERRNRNKRPSEAYLPLGQLFRPLVLRVPEQFHHATLVRSETSDFADKFPDVLGLFGDRLLRGWGDGNC